MACMAARLEGVMRLRALLVLVFAVTIGSCERSHPISDENAAIAAAHAEWKRLFPDAVGENDDEWQQTFSATLSDGIWLVRQKMAMPGDQRGAYIYVEARTGRIVDAKTVD
jgi:hypothetical protein